MRYKGNNDFLEKLSACKSSVITVRIYVEPFFKIKKKIWSQHLKGSIL